MPLRTIKGAPYGFDETTLDALEKWKCKPVELGGKLVSLFFRLRLIFTTEGLAALFQFGEDHFGEFF